MPRAGDARVDYCSEPVSCCRKVVTLPNVPSRRLGERRPPAVVEDQFSHRRRKGDRVAGRDQKSGHAGDHDFPNSPVRSGHHRYPACLRL